MIKPQSKFEINSNCRSGDMSILIKLKTGYYGPER